MLYFAYGSNMSTPRIRQRVPSALALSIAVLDGHRLAFHKVGRDGSAKCDIPACSDGDAWVYGVVFHIDPAHRTLLDQAEGLGNGYERKPVDVHSPDGTCWSAFAYCATHTDATLRPFDWYKTHVLTGAAEHGMPSEYIAMIAGVESVVDPDPRRHHSELAVYSRAGDSQPDSLDE